MLHSKLVSRSFCNKRVRRTVPLTNVSNDFNGEEIAPMFYEKELQKNSKRI